MKDMVKLTFDDASSMVGRIKSRRQSLASGHFDLEERISLMLNAGSETAYMIWISKGIKLLSSSAGSDGR